MEKELFTAVLMCILMGYFIGCISPSYVIGRIRGYDVRESGSKNAGASNTVIMAGKLAGFFVAVTDIFKAWAAWRLAQYFFPRIALAGVISGSACVIGHIYPVFLRFKGGKGFACLGGLALAHGTGSFVCLLSIAIAIAVFVKYVSIVTSVMSVVFPLWYWVTGGTLLGMLILLIPCGPIISRHMENFRRIKEGRELRISYLWNKSDELERAGYGEK